MVVDLTIKNGVVYTPFGMLRAGVAIDEGKIVTVAKEMNLPKADKTIDALGKFVLPGLVDAHTHIREPGYEHKEDFITGTMAAAAAGVTMIMPQPNLDPVPNNVDNYMLQVNLGEKKSLIDFNPMASPLLYEEGWVPKLAELGTIGFKIFQKVAAYPYDTGAGTLNTAHIYKAFKEVAKTGLWCAVHPFNKDFFDEHISDLEKAGKLDKESFWTGMYSAEEMASSAHMLRYLARKAGVKYYMLHCGNLLDYIELAKEAKQEGEKVIADSIWSVFVPSPTKEEAGKGQNIIRHTAPDERAARWRACLDGTIDFIDTDHAPHLIDEIDTKDPREAAAGYPAYPHYFSLLLTEVNKGVCQLKDLIKLLSENPAKIFNIFPKKGAIQVGSDADIVIVDMKREGKITSKRLYTKCGWSPYIGRKIKGMPILTILRGTVIAEEGVVIGKPGHGEFVKPEKPKA